MSWEQVGQIAVAAIISAGGIGGIIIGVVKFSANQIAERMSKKFEASLNKELEKYKTELSKKEYVSKTRFDTEFSLYRELSKAFAEMIKGINLLIPSGLTLVPADQAERAEADKRHYQAAVPVVVKAQDTLFANIPFISEDIYSKYEELLRLGMLQLSEYEDRFNIGDLRPQKEKESFSREAYSRTREMNEKWKTLNSLIRTYVASLDVLEDNHNG